MDATPNAASTGNFEFEALQFAGNYRRALLEEFRPHLRGQIVEVGAGVGQFTELVAQLPGVKNVLAVEPDSGFNAEFRRRLPAFPLVAGVITDLPAGSECDSIVSVNVLEHIAADEAELAAYARLLKKSGGALCLYVPARPEIYAPLDKDFGHFRRYTKAGLREKLERAGFVLERLYYFNAVGYFAWWLNFCVLRRRRFDVAMVKFFDGVIFPPMHALESRVMRPPFGQSLLAVARAEQ